MKEILIVGVGVMGRPYLDAAAALGCRIRAVEAGPATGDRPDVDVQSYYVDNVLDESWLHGVMNAVTDRIPDGILAFAEPNVISGALAQERFGLPGPSLHAAVISRNKALQRSCFDACGVSQPEFKLAAGLAEAREWMTARLPVVVKPLTLAGSQGVELITDAAQVDEVIERRGAEGKILIERAVSGPEYSWEALVRDGEVLFENFTEKETTTPPYFVELTHRCGHRFTDPAVAAQVGVLTRGVLDALGMRTGLVHLEFRVSPDGPVLMEVAVRTPGDYLADAIGLTYGFDLYQAVVRLTLGLPLEDLVNTEPVSYAATCFPTCEPGTIREISGVDEVLAHPAVVRVALRKKVGDVVHPLISSSQRLGHVLVRASSPEEREEALEYVHKTLRISVD